jgi:hypothetical protein
MKKLAFIYFLLVAYVTLQSQEAADDPAATPIKTSHIVKAGASIQYEWSGGYYYGDDYFYYDYYWYDNHLTSLAYYDGPNTQVFLAYEHIWTFPVKMGVSIEPKIGLSFREYLTNGFVGANWKFFWADLGHWRMGLYLYTGYEYLQSDRYIYVSMEGGMYRKLTNVTLHQNVFSFDLGLVPFQFTPKNSPIMVELNLNFLGLHIFKIRSKEYDKGNGETGKYKYNDVGGYGPRVELKVGWAIR